MESSFKLGKIAGIEIGVHYSWLLALGLVTWSLAWSMFPLEYPRWNELTYWVAALIAALLLFGCVLLHELSHSVVARARGMSVAGITLFILGGVSNIRGEAEKPADEFWMAIVGPLTSLALAALAGLLWLAVSGNSPLSAVLRYLAYANLLLAVFNLIPGFPLDGGRVVRSILWAALRDLRRATRIATRMGQGVAYLFILGGLILVFRGPGIQLNGIWLVIIGWFLLNAAVTSYRQLTASRLQRLSVGALLRTAPVVVPGSLPVAELVDRYMLGQGLRAVMVAEAGRIVGLVSLTDVKHLAVERWPTTPVSAVMTPAAKLAVVSPESSLQEALASLAEHDVNQLPVVRDGALVGLLSRGDVIGYLQLREALDEQAARQPPRPPAPGASSPGRPQG